MQFQNERGKLRNVFDGLLIPRALLTIRRVGLTMARPPFLNRRTQLRMACAPFLIARTPLTILYALLGIGQGKIECVGIDDTLPYRLGFCPINISFNQIEFVFVVFSEFVFLFQREQFFAGF